jgi:hypothetical protein
MGNMPGFWEMLIMKGKFNKRKVFKDEFADMLRGNYHCKALRSY